MSFAVFAALRENSRQNLESLFSIRGQGMTGAPRIIVRVFGAVAFILLTIAAISAYTTIQTLSREQRAPGRVVDLVAHSVQSTSDEDAQLFYYPVVEFNLPDETHLRIELSQGSRPPSHAKGERVTILYNPAQPQQARIQSFTSTLLLWIVPFITGLLGLIFAGVTLFAYRLLRADLGMRFQ